MQKTLSFINLNAIRANAQHVRGIIGSRFFYAVVKADGYGHGGIETALAIEDIVNGFCVAITEEGVALRLGGITKPVLVLTPPLGESDVLKMKHYRLTPTVGDENSAKLVAGMGCHIAVNTGMNRYGCHGERLERVLAVLPRGSVEGVFTHLYAAENEGECVRQLNAFNTAKRAVVSHSPKAFPHIAASGGILRGGEYLQDGVRCGLMLYGYAPAGFSSKGLEPALKVYARLSAQTQVTGGGVGYNIADRKYERLYTYRLGYADGFARGVPLGEKTLCMDAFISTEKSELMPVFENAEEYAKRCGTITYEVLCSVTRRSERIYIN
ncbi:MAG: alanine racemase [Clostridia bacterium]|nr:alanine racemase [Clostridia bacterium]